MAAATAWYRDGTVSVTSGSKAIIGVGTAWLSQVLPGDLFYLADANGNLTSVPAEVDTVGSDTAINLKAIWPGSTVSGVKYGIVRHFNNTLPADLSARLSKLIANYQITVDQFITLLTSSSQATITGLDGNNYTVLGLLGYANQVPDHNASDAAHGMTATGKAVLQAATAAAARTAIGVDAAGTAASAVTAHNSDANAHGTPEQRRNALGLNNHQLVSVDGDGRQIIGGGSPIGFDLTLNQAAATGGKGLLIYTEGGVFGGYVTIGVVDAKSATIQVGDESVYRPLKINPLGGAVLLRAAPDDGTSALQVGGAIVHGTDNAWAYGSAARRGTTIYLATNPVIGSDARLKTDTEAIPAAIAAEICGLLTPYTYLYKVGGQEAYEVEEDYEVTEPVTEPVTTERTVIEIIDGQAVQVVKTETAQQPVYDLLLVVDEAGEPVLDADGKQLTHQVQRTVKVNKTRKVTKCREVAGTRWHTGYIAQEVKAALDAVADRWPRAANLAVWLLADADDADSTQMIRMEQMIPIIHAAMRYRAH